MEGIGLLLDAITIILELVVLFIKRKRNNRVSKASFLAKIRDGSVTTQTRVTSELTKKGKFIFQEARHFSCPLLSDRLWALSRSVAM